jgi:hypothetical protein
MRIILQVLVDRDYRQSVLEQNRVTTEMRQWHEEQLTVRAKEFHLSACLLDVDVSGGSSPASRGRQYCSPSNSRNRQVCMILSEYSLNVISLLQRSLPQFGQIMLSHPAGHFTDLLSAIHRLSV